MKLYSRAWVRRVQQQGVLPARSWRHWGTYLRPLRECWRLLILITLAFMAHTGMTIAHFEMELHPGSHPPGYLHALTNWLLFMLIIRVAWQIQEFIFSPQSANPLLPLPVNNAMAFVFSKNQIARFSAWIVGDAFAFFLGASGFSFLWPDLARSIGVALLIWATHLSLAFLFTLFVFSIPKRWHLYWIGVLLLILTVLAMAFVGGFVGGFAEKQKDSSLPAFTTLNSILQKGTPVGWSTSWAQWIAVARAGTPAPPAATAVGLGLLLLSTPWSYRTLRRRFVFRSYDDDIEHLLPASNDECEAYAELPSKKENPAIVESVILSRSWLALPDKKHPGWIERFIDKGETPRQKTLSVDLIHYTANYFFAYVLLALVTVLSFFLIGAWQPAAISSLLAAGGIIALVLQIPVPGENVPGMNTPAFVSTGNTAFNSLLPVGISELRNLFVRIVYRRTLLTLPTFLWLGVCFSAFNSGSWTGGLFPAFVLWLASLAIAPCWFIFKISPQTRDTRSSFWLTGTIFGAGFLGAGLLVALFFISLNSPWWFSFVNLLLLALHVRGFEALYLHWYRRGRFDLIAPVPSR